LEASVNVGAEKSESGVLPDLSLVLEEESTDDAWMTKVLIGLVDSNETGANCFHFTEKI
jgi:hypothetical protein